MHTYTRDLQEAKQRLLTPFEVIRDEWYQTIMERDMKWIKNIEDVSRFAMLNQTVIKPNSMVNFSTKYRKRYNKKSLDNLVQNQPKEVDNLLKSIKNETEITDVNDWSQEYIDQYEGLEMKAYTATKYEKKVGQYTIGYGTSYLYKQDGSPFVTGYFKGVRKGGNGVRPADTLDGLKKAMGYGNLSNEAFATRLIINHIYAKGGAYDVISKYFDLMLIPFNQALKDGLQEFAYGSQDIVKHVKGHTKNISDILLLRRPDLLAPAYVNLRIGYYKGIKAWNPKKDGNALSNRFSWCKRVYVTAMHIKGVNTSMSSIDRATNNGGSIKRLQNLEKYFYKDLGVSVKLV